MPVPSELGVETERVPLQEVFERRVWFPEGGIYILRAADKVMYVGLTNKPLRLRLKGQIASRKTWAVAEYADWSVTMQRLPEWPNDHKRELELIAALRPVFNVLGRPRKPRDGAARCACLDTCPDCGLPRVPRARPVAEGP